MNDKSNVTPEVSKYFSELGKKGGKKLLEQRGREYFVNLRKLSKGRKKVKEVNNE